MTTVKYHKFTTKEEAAAFSETQKPYWDLGYGHIMGPYMDPVTYNDYWEVSEVVEPVHA